jgi:hypothetical protein
MDERAWSHLRLFVMLLCLFFSMVAVVLGAAALYYVVDTTTKIRDTQLEGTPLGKRLQKSTDDTATSLELLQDCLNEDGECARANRENQARVLDQLRNDMFIIGACMEAGDHRTEEQIRACYFETQKKAP